MRCFLTGVTRNNKVPCIRVVGRAQKRLTTIVIKINGYNVSIKKEFVMKKKMTCMLATGMLCVLMSGCTCGKASAPAAQCEVAPEKAAPAKAAPEKAAPEKAAPAAAVPVAKPAL